MVISARTTSHASTTPTAGWNRVSSGHLYAVKMTCAHSPRRLSPNGRRPAVAGWHNPADSNRSDYALAACQRRAQNDDARQRGAAGRRSKGCVGAQEVSTLMTIMMAKALTRTTAALCCLMTFISLLSRSIGSPASGAAAPSPLIDYCGAIQLFYQFYQRVQELNSRIMMRCNENRVHRKISR